MTVRVLSLLVVSVAGAPLSAQTISGRVVDAETREPLAGANVRALGDSTRPAGGAVADSRGRFRIRLDGAGEFRLAADLEGYVATTSDPLRVRPGAEVTVEVRLARLVVSVEPLDVVVSGERFSPVLRGFDRRRERGWGEFLDREALDAQHGTRLIVALEGLPSVDVRPIRDRGVAAYSAFRRRVPVITGKDCLPLVYLDGRSLRPMAGDRYDHLDFLATAVVADFEAVEVYRGLSQAPRSSRTPAPGAASSCSGPDADPDRPHAGVSRPASAEAGGALTPPRHRP